MKVSFEPFKDEDFEESELGLIPKSWRVVNLPEMIEINPIRRIWELFPKRLPMPGPMRN